LIYGLDDQGFEFWWGLEIFLFTTTARMALGPTQPPIQWIPGALSLGAKWLGHEADHSLSSSADKNMWSYTSTPQYASMAWCSVEAQGLLYLLPLLYYEANQFHVWELAFYIFYTTFKPRTSHKCVMIMN
jgi:hypothetical protein